MFVKFENDLVPPADRKRATVQRPETVGTYFKLMLGLVDSIFVHTMRAS